MLYSQGPGRPKRAFKSYFSRANEVRRKQGTYGSTVSSRQTTSLRTQRRRLAIFGNPPKTRGASSAPTSYPPTKPNLSTLAADTNQTHSPLRKTSSSTLRHHTDPPSPNTQDKDGQHQIRHRPRHGPVSEIGRGARVRRDGAGNGGGALRSG